MGIHDNPAAIEETRQGLETMGIESCADLERAIAGPVGDVREALDRVVILGDAFNQSVSESGDKDPASAGKTWAEAALDFIEEGIKKGRVSRSMAKFSILNQRSGRSQVRAWQEAREEAFVRNPQYHGPRFGIEYARAVAAGRLT